MRCPSCQNENAVGAVYCDMCGFDLAPAASAPAGPSAPAARPPPPPINPHQKRHTVFEPDSASPPQRGGADFFAHPPPPRPTFDPRDPFAAASLPPRPAAPPEPVPAPVPRAPEPRPKARTLVETSEGVAVGLLRGALLEYRGPTDPGRLHALRAGRNVIGRNPDCDVVIDDGRVSGQHAFLFVRAEDASYMDVSSNGSVIDGSVVHGEQVILGNHAVITLGGTTLVLVVVPEQVLSRRTS